MMNLRQRFQMPEGRKLRVAIQARFSTEEQRQSSIDDQIANCKRFLADNLPSGVGLDRVEVEEIREPEISGELLKRPGIDRVWVGIEARRWDVLIAEETSRLYRNMGFAFNLFGAAIDAGIRVICPTDMIDTADEDWPDRLMMSQSQHSRANFFTRYRIKRSIEGLWARGAALGGVKLGYRRRASRPATANSPAGGPYFDEIDEEQAPVIREIFERVAGGEPLWAVADWLTSIHFRKAKNSQSPDWSDRNVMDLVRRPDYRGVQEHRKKVSKQQLTTGRSRPRWNTPDAVLTRESPHLRIVSDHLWYEANAVIDRRQTRRNVPRGHDHPLTGRPRDSRGLLSTIFVCGICGGIMHAEGRNEGGYRCANARARKCWNRTTCVRKEAHEAILAAVEKAVMSLTGGREQLVTRVRELRASGGDLAAAQRALESEKAKLMKKIDSLGRALEEAGDATASLVPRLTAREQELKVVQSRLEELKARAQERKPPPTADDIVLHLESLQADLQADEGRAGVILRQLLGGPIRAIPHQQFGSDKVVLRAEFTLVLTRALPAEVAASLESNSDSTTVDLPIERPLMLVELFRPSALARHALGAHELAETGMSLKKVGEALGISKRQAHLCSQLGARMAAAGVTDPFVRLTARPAKVSRWNRRPGEWGQGDERKAG
jgi:DNA invertase Pin-like site-specific DNA recombinase